jgi:carbon storage regulator
MLVLSRKYGQQFRIGDDVMITIVKVDRNSVRIGIDAPANIAICRKELAQHTRPLPVESGAT